MSSTRYHRRSLRLRGCDYSGAGAYSVTICTHERECLFGNVIDGTMALNDCGRIVVQEIAFTGSLRPYATIDAHVVMPNHVHMIVIINDGTAPCRDMARHVPTGDREFGRPQPGSLSAIVGAIKSAVTRRIHGLPGHAGMPVWQSRFHEHIIRNGRSYDAIRRYILENTMQWEHDEENPDCRT
ncbi:MAG: transposase [Candidatus Edwardsbacteria bacterium]|nr:transposase [Candidatus Edwardsbacteria bacterium]